MAVASIDRLDKFLDKLDAQKLVGAVRQQIIESATKAGHDQLLASVPRKTGATASAITAEVFPMTGRISGPRVPLVFLERGSRYPNAGGAPRVHRARGRGRTADLRIKPRRYLAQARAVAAKKITADIEAAKAAIESRWSA